MTSLRFRSPGILANSAYPHRPGADCCPMIPLPLLLHVREQLTDVQLQHRPAFHRPPRQKIGYDGRPIRILLKPVDFHTAPVRVDNPVLAYAVVSITLALDAAVLPGRAGRQDLDHQVWW